MDFLPKDIENIILDYKFQLEYVDKYEKTIKLIDESYYYEIRFIYHNLDISNQTFELEYCSTCGEFDFFVHVRDHDGIPVRMLCMCN